MADMTAHELSTLLNMVEGGNNRAIAMVLRAIVEGRTSVLVAGNAVSVTASSGALPTANGAVTIADAATPTVDELLEFCVELNAKLAAL